MRKIAMATAAQLRILALTPASLVTSYVTPLAVAAVIISLYGRPTPALLVGTVAAAIWNTLLLQSLLIISQERSWGTMQLISATPTAMAVVLIGRLIGALIQAAVAIPLTLVLSLAAGGIPPLGPWPLLLACSVEILAGLMGMAVLHITLNIRYRSYTALVNAIFPLSIALMGLFVPLNRMPLGLNILGRMSAVSWAMDGIRDAAWEPLLPGAATALACVVACVWYVSYLRGWMRTTPAAYYN